MFRRAAAAPQRVLLVDFDGTLAPFALRPQDARPYAGIVPVLDDIMRHPANRVVIVTGRDLAQPPALELSREPEIWAAHGWQWRPSQGAPVLHKPPAESAAHLALAFGRAEPLARCGARLERKAASVAVHWRGLDATTVQGVREALRLAWRSFARLRELELLEFDGGVELRVRGWNKGRVVRKVLADIRPDAVVAYLGDDRTDEDAFSAVRGRGFGVLVRASWRRTDATLWLRPPEELSAFLSRWRDCACAAR